MARQQSRWTDYSWVPYDWLCRAISEGMERPALQRGRLLLASFSLDPPVLI